MERELPRRRNIRLKEYDYSQPGYYFVTICTHQKQALFSSLVGAHLCARQPVETHLLSAWLYELEQKYPGVLVDCWAVMPDHLHIILAITGAHTGAPLPEIIKWYKTQTTNAYIQKVRRGELPPFQKHIWQRGYYDHVIRNDSDLSDTRQYILNNPLKRILNKD